MRAAGAGRIVLAAPVAPPDALAALQAEADEIVCLAAPSPFFTVGAHYQVFTQLADADIGVLLEARERASSGSAGRRQ